MDRAIDVLNEEMIAAGVRIFVGGLLRFIDKGIEVQRLRITAV